ncbi:MAG TPA: alpha/beta family hydrolase [Candidatus Eisenbacteria bacterium]|nr:alpha/beta family hydrolase [Candidatus Eisenbacteria bacterium]
MTSVSGKAVSFDAGDRAGPISGLFLRPASSEALLVLAHGAGAGMRHSFMETISEKLAVSRIATLRYQFPYMERGARRPDPAGVLTATVRASIAAARRLAGDLPLFAGGKSMGGRMTSLAAAQEPLPAVRGLVFFGFPLHAAGRPSADRGRHLVEVDLPMLFLQGSRDSLADLSLLTPLCGRLGDRAELFVVPGGDHSFHMPRRSGRSDQEVLDTMAAKVASWIARRASRG